MLRRQKKVVTCREVGWETNFWRLGWGGRQIFTIHPFSSMWKYHMFRNQMEERKEGRMEVKVARGRNSRYFKNTFPGLCSCYFHFLDDLLDLTPTPILPYFARKTPVDASEPNSPATSFVTMSPKQSSSVLLSTLVGMYTPHRHRQEMPCSLL